MSISQVVDYAMRNNGELKSFREEKGIREAGRIKAGLLTNPTIDLEAATGALTGSSDESSVALGISQQFQLYGKRDKRLEVADRELESYRWQLADRERVLKGEVMTAVYDAVLAERRLGLAEHAVMSSGQLLDVTRERLAAGDIPELEMDLAKVELARNEGARINVANLLNQSRARLSTLMGAPEGESPALAGTLDTGSAIPKNFSELKELARANRPDLKALESEQRRGEAETSLAKAEAMPDLTAGLVFRRDTTSMEVGGLEGHDTAYTVGFRLSMPIPLFDKNQAGLQEARARRSSAESRLLAERRNVEREVETAYASYVNSEKVVLLYQAKVMPQLEENLKLTQEAYRIGEVGILAVVQEQKKFFEVSEAYLTSLHDRQTALVKLQSAVATELTGGIK